MVEAAVAAGDQRGDQLGDHRAERDDDARLAGGRRDDAQVLVVQGEPEARRELAGEHVRALAVQHGAAGQAAAEHLQRGLRVHAVRLEEDDRLGEQLDVAGDDELVRGLDGLARARRARRARSSCRRRRARASRPRSRRARRPP